MKSLFELTFRHNIPECHSYAMVNFVTNERCLLPLFINIESRNLVNA